MTKRKATNNNKASKIRDKGLEVTTKAHPTNAIDGQTYKPLDLDVKLTSSSRLVSLK